MHDLSELAAHCIRCGFCLESCPTFSETGRETDSPRGRIYLVRSALEGHLAWQQETVGQYLEPCLGCRACETACPSGVRYGTILELARERLAEIQPRGAMRRVLGLLTSPAKLHFLLALGRLMPGKRLPRAASRLLTREGPEADKPRAQRLSSWPPLAENSLPPVRGEVYLLEGCAMRTLFPRVHEATRRLLRRVGYEVRNSEAGCCGALHAHQGMLSQGSEMLRDLAAAMPGDLPIVVNSAGCGSFMKDHSEVLICRVFDVSEFLLAEGLAELLRSLPASRNAATPQRRNTGGSVSAPAVRLSESGDRSPQSKVRVAYHDACHLIHGQKVFREPRELLSAVPGIELVDLPESDFCCGSAGTYNLTQPKMARRLLERKWRNVEASGAEIVVLGNPGCHAWIEQAARENGGRVRVMHTAELLEAAFSGLRGLE